MEIQIHASVSVSSRVQQHHSLNEAVKIALLVTFMRGSEPATSAITFTRAGGAEHDGCSPD